MARPTAKKIQVGFALKINRYNQPGGWERVGFLFNNKGEANRWRETHCPQVTKYSIYKVRVDATKASVSQNRFEVGATNAAQ